MYKYMYTVYMYILSFLISTLWYLSLADENEKLHDELLKQIDQLNTEVRIQRDYLLRIQELEKQLAQVWTCVYVHCVHTLYFCLYLHTRPENIMLQICLIMLFFYAQKISTLCSIIVTLCFKFHKYALKKHRKNKQ